MLATREDVEVLFGCTFDGDDVLAIDAALTAADATAKAYIGTDLELVAGREEWHHILRADHRLELDHWPVAVVTAVEEYPNGPAGAADAVVANEGYVVADEQFARLHRIWSAQSQRSWMVGYNTVKITYDSGYAAVPADVRDAVATAAYRSYTDSAAGVGSTTGAVQSEALGEYRVDYGSAEAGATLAARTRLGFKVAELNVLAPYRRFAVQ